LINNTILAIEIDENQHKNYIKINEDADIMIYLWILVENIFLSDIIQMKIIWNYHIRVLKKRCNLLIQEITKQIKIINDGTNDDLINIIHLYYN
jgi:hypothetical protein